MGCWLCRRGEDKTASNHKAQILYVSTSNYLLFLLPSKVSAAPHKGLSSDKDFFPPLPDKHVQNTKAKNPARVVRRQKHQNWDQRIPNNLDIRHTEAFLSTSEKKKVPNLWYLCPEKQDTLQNYRECCNSHHSTSKAKFVNF